MAKINGVTAAQADGKSISEYIEEKSYNPQRIAVEINGEILPKSMYSSTVINTEDSIEIVEFMGGG